MVLLSSDRMDSLFSPRCVWVNGPIIIGAGPSGLAVGASLGEQGVPYVMLEREDCIASLWQKRTYDRLKLHLPYFILGNLAGFGPLTLTLKNMYGKTPVLDTGALAKIRSGEITVVPGVSRFTKSRAELTDGTALDLDAVVMATGYRSNVPQWLQGTDFFGKDGYPTTALDLDAVVMATGYRSNVPQWLQGTDFFGKDGYPTTAFLNGWKGKSGLYSVGFTRRGLSGASAASGEMEYIGRWLVVATGENAKNVVPDIPSLDGFAGEVAHVNEYKSGEKYKGKRVLVVGCGNSGMQVSLDLCDHGVLRSMVVRDAVHVLPREVMGKSTFELAKLLMAWLPLWFFDKVMVFLSYFILGNLAGFGIRRPAIGPLTLKNMYGKTPVLDTGVLAEIWSDEITVVPGVSWFTKSRAELTDGTALDLDAVVMATGYRSNVPQWFQGTDGYPTTAFPNGWKGKSGLYSVGFTRRGLSDASAASGEMECIGRWLVVATGENAENVVPDILGLDGFAGEVAHVSEYKSGKKYKGKRVPVVGCGNSGMEVSLDLCDHGALPSMVVRDAVHVLPREVMGKSTFELATLLTAWLPLWFVDKVMVFLSYITKMDFYLKAHSMSEDMKLVSDEEEANNYSLRFEELKGKQGVTKHFCTSPLSTYDESESEKKGYFRAVCGSYKNTKKWKDETQVFVDFCGSSMSLQSNLNTSNVNMLIEAACARAGVKSNDCYAIFCGKVLKPEQLLSSYHIKRDSTIRVNTRIKGGKCQTIDFQTWNDKINTCDWHYTITLPRALHAPSNRIISVKYLSKQLRYWSRQVLIGLCRKHFSDISFDGDFTSDQLLFEHGNFRFDDSVPIKQYNRASALLDYAKISAIFKKAFRANGSLPMHSSHLLDFLLHPPQTADPQSKAVTGFLCNHYCLLSYSDRIKISEILDTLLRMLQGKDYKNFASSIGNIVWTKTIATIPSMNDVYIFHAKYDKNNIITSIPYSNSSISLLKLVNSWMNVH